MNRSCEKKNRTLWKCAFCRSQKRRCEPSNRNWPGQKCDACQKRNLSCGPNTRHRPYSYNKKTSLQTHSSSNTGASDPNSRQSSPVSPETFMIPFDRDSDFTGKVTELDQLENILCAAQGHRRAALVGLGGVGKSQIAIEFSYRQRGKPFSRTLWSSATDLSQFDDSWSSIATVLGLGESSSPDTDPFDLVMGFLERDQHERTLIVIDNVDDVILSDCSTTGSRQLSRSLDISKALPSLPNVSILFTSRSRDTAFRLTGLHTANLETAPMSDKEALELIQKKVPDGSFANEACTKTVKLLENLPLAITQAAAYMQSRAMTLQRFTEHFERSEADRTALLCNDMGDLRRKGNSTHSVLANLHSTFDLIKIKSPMAIGILSKAAFLYHKNIPVYLLCSKDSDVDQSLAVEDAIGMLVGFGLVDRATAGESTSVSMKVIAQISVREWLKSNDCLEQTKGHALQLVLDNLPNLNHISWGQYMRLGPHIEGVLGHQFTTKDHRRRKTDLQYAIGRFYLNVGAAKLSASVALEADRGRTQLLGKDHTETIQSRSLLASIHAFQGQNHLAKHILRDFLFSPTRSHSPYSATGVECLNNLAALHLFEDEFREAESLIRTAFRRLNEQPRPAPSQNQSGLLQIEMLALEEVFATLKRMLRDEDAAKKIYSHINNQRSETLGPQHPFTLISTSNLASTAFALSRSIPDRVDSLQSTIETYQNVLRLRKNLLGSNHPATLKTTSNLAILNYALSFATNDTRIAFESVESMKKIFETQCLTIGENHFLTKVTGVSLSLMYSWQGNVVDVMKLLPQLQSTNSGADITIDQESTSIDRCLSVVRQTGVFLNPRQHYMNFARIKSVKTIAVEHPDLIVIEWALAFDVDTGY